jgi:SAM-dependent methyltransferase
VLLDAFPIPSEPDSRRVAFLAGCHGCGLLFANPLPTAEQQRQYYADGGPWARMRVEKRHGLAPEARERKAKKRAAAARKPSGPELLLDALAPYAPVHAPPPHSKVLDFGCGDGKLLNRLKERGWQTYGIEPSTDRPFVRHARLAEPPRDASFDLVVLHHVLEHVTAPTDVLRQLAGALRDGGILLVSVPSVDTLPQHGDFRYCIDGRRHLMCFTERCLTGLLARAGFGAVTRLELPELDRLRTKGIPMRLRMIAMRTSAPPSPPVQPLAHALALLRAYVKAHLSLAERFAYILPVRTRGAWIDRRRQRARRRRAEAPEPTSSPPFGGRAA